MKTNKIKSIVDCNKANLEKDSITPIQINYSCHKNSFLQTLYDQFSDNSDEQKVFFS